MLELPPWADLSRKMDIPAHRYQDSHVCRQDTLAQVPSCPWLQPNRLAVKDIHLQHFLLCIVLLLQGEPKDQEAM